MNLLTNYPLEMFGARSEFPFERIVSFGPAQGRQVGEEVFPYDVPFDGARQPFTELVAALPAGFAPECIMLWWPDQDPIPEGLERAECPVVGVVSDYNLSLPYLRRTWPFFDLVLCDRPGLQVLGRQQFARVEPWCQHSFRPDVHRDYGEARDIDVSFIGNLNPVVQRERMPWLDRVRAMAERYRVRVGTAPQGEPYGRLVARSRIVFNRSIRGEANLRSFEATAAGALLFVERENVEIRDYFVPGREIVLYGPDDLEAKIEHYLENEEERSRIAAAGARRVQDHRLSALFAPLPALIAELDPARRPTGSRMIRDLGRGEALLAGLDTGSAAIACLHECVMRFPGNPMARNNLATGLVHVAPQMTDVHTLERLYADAVQTRPDYVPARLNLANLYAAHGAPDRARAVVDTALAVLDGGPGFDALDGLCIPLGFSSVMVSHAAALCAATRAQDPTPLAEWFRRELSAIRQTAEEREREDPGVVPVRELEAEGVAAHDVGVDDRHVLGH